ncbi:hypothetical protein DH86_00001985 [Scytalidium sp. 3C]|nr:hypothetical protein DH86_00001985 [Scytalidium sp. 3C]
MLRLPFSMSMQNFAIKLRKPSSLLRDELGSPMTVLSGQQMRITRKPCSIFGVYSMSEDTYTNRNMRDGIV